MKFLTLSAALFASVVSADFFGCPIDKWEEPATQLEKDESDCIFYKIGHGDKILGKDEMISGMEGYCHWRWPSYTDAQCTKMADYEAVALVKTFGADGTFTKDNFFFVYLAFKGNEQPGAEEDSKLFFK